MKKRHSIHLLLAAAALLLAMAACTKDELADGDRLPEGQYPLEIARITLGVEGGEAQPWGTPQTRVSEKEDGNSSKFDAGDKFAVQIDGKDEVGTYTVQDDGTATSDAPLYWTNTTPNRTVSAWYPATDGTLDLGDQSQSLAYLLGGSGTGDYQTPVTLTFAHQLAKVRVTPIGDALGEVQSLQLYTYTQCTYEKGKAGQGSQEGWIEMKKCEYTENGATITCWEANVVPGYAISKLRANGTEERNLSAAFTPEAGKFYNITLDYDKGYNLSTDGKTYEVYNANGLLAWNEAARKDLSINCTLTADIDLTGKTWTPIGDGSTSANSYQGTFDGQGHRIKGLTITTDNPQGESAALFYGISGNGEVKNLQLVDVDYDVKQVGASGGIVHINHGTLTACSVTGTITTARGNPAGIACLNYGTITACWFNGTITGTTPSNIATNNSDTITACYFGENGYGGVAWDFGTTDTHAIGTDESWQPAIDGMNPALTGNDYQWVLGPDDLPVLQKKQ
mgnify:CR=1 FL=1